MLDHFGVNAEPFALPCRDDVVVENGAAAPKSCLSTLETCTTTTAVGVLPTDKTTTATWTTLDQPTLWFPLIEEKKLRTSTPSGSYDSSFWRNNLLAAPSCQSVIETKYGQNLMFDPGGSTGRLHAYPFLGTWCELLCGEVHVRALEEAAAFF